LTQNEPAAPAAQLNRPPARYAVTVEFTVQAGNAAEAPLIVRSFLSDVFSESGYKMGNVVHTMVEPPSDETWQRALDCAGALA
jgi:hypothetical protein